MIQPAAERVAALRVDGLSKVTGREHYTADVRPAGCLVGKALRSPHPHARILHVDTSRAVRLVGVKAVLTGADVRGQLIGRILHDMPILAHDRVRFVGEKVAAVAAVDRDAVDEALSLIEVEYEELPAVFDPSAAMQEGSPILHPNMRSYRGVPADLPDLPNLQSRIHREKGDVEQGLADSDHVFEYVFSTPTVHQGYLEPHTCLVSAQSDRMDVWASNKSPFKLRDLLARLAGLADDAVLIHPPAIGGDFGGKGSFMDAPLCYFLSAASGYPVKMIMSFAEELMAANPRHAATIYMRTGVKADGRLWARDFRIVYDGGAYGAFKPSGHVNLNGAMQGAGPYRIPHVRLEGLCMYTNTTPRGHFRAPGEAQALFGVESATDMIAAELKMDPYEFRKLNALNHGDADGQDRRLENIRVHAVLDAAIAASNWGKPKPRAHVGRGIAVFNRHAADGQCSARVTLGPDGLLLTVALPDTGTGLHTTLREVAARTMGVHAHQVRVEVGTTDSVPPDAGVGATRVTLVAGTAAQLASQQVKTAFLERVGQVYGWDPGHLDIADGVICGPGGASLDFSEGVRGVVEQQEEKIEATVTYAPDHGRFPTVATGQVAEVEVDPETGAVHVLSFVSAHDVGTIFNEVLHQGQIDGGIGQGIGYALMEEMPLEEGRVETLNLGDYKLPTQQDIPPLTTIMVPGGEGSGPLQAKPIGESALSGVAPAIANAIYDAVGVRLTSLPLTGEKVRQQLAAR